ncbi:hypothetical protein V9K67_09980 [Paraflavisolibacter sp. H34]|uniref:hypothetical protein n=1 Tax=Huijunlia imazamoxiresistens TaxID=3127457 RepID=UPI003019AAC6
MAAFRSNKQRKRFLLYFLGFFLLVFVVLFVFANRFVAPVLRDRLNTLIVTGSDSLYTYQLGKLNVNFFGGNVEVNDLHIWVDSTHYQKLDRQKALPALTFRLDLQKGHIKGLGVYALIFGKQIRIKEILSREAKVNLSRHVYEKVKEGKKVEADTAYEAVPLWKAIQPMIRSIDIGRIHLDGIELLYKNADTARSVKLQFDRCEALFEDVRVDSLAEADTGRIAFTRAITMDFYDLKFRTPDSTYKMKAEVIRYSSTKRTFEINDFKLQPTLKREEFVRTAAHQQSLYTVLFKKALFTGLQLERFINNNVLAADSVLIEEPDIDIYNDKTLPSIFVNKIGQYPHQHLLRSSATVQVNGMRLSQGRLAYTEKAEKTGKEGTLAFDNLNAVFSNVTNDPRISSKTPECTALLTATMFRNAPVTLGFTFYLNETDGKFAARGGIKGVSAAQLNTVAEPLGNIHIQSLQVDSLSFLVQGDDYSARGEVHMRYRNLMLVLRKADEETGQVKTKKFLTKLLNKFALYDSNPGSDGKERVATNVVYARTSSKSFIGVVWKTIFAGMQNIMMTAGRYE